MRLPNRRDRAGLHDDGERAVGRDGGCAVLTRLSLFILLSVVGGLGSAWYMIEKGTRVTTQVVGPWVAWTAAGRPDADPYTRAHFLRRGVLPVTTAIAYAFHANVDSEGQALYSSCEYLVEGDEPKAAFWSLSAFDDRGRLIQNAAERYSFNTATIARGPGNRLDVMLARSARPGNWLPTSGAGRFSLVMTVEEPRLATGADGVATARQIELPAIRRLTCR